jgi:pimeloyl-ACP methyl ester carboxylesterase
MATFVLLHGHYLGRWCWEKVIPPLTSAGHHAIALGLTGMGEMEDVGTPATGLRDHVLEVAAALEGQDLREVTLVGHSYAGLVVLGAADRVPHRVERLVFLDALVATPGQRVFDLMPGQESAIRAAAAQHGGYRVPPPDPAAVGVTDPEQRAYLQARLTTVPLGTFEGPLDRSAGNGWMGPHVYIQCLDSPISAPFADAARHRPGWTVRHLDSGHLPMITHPARLAHALLESLEHARPEY